MGRRAGAGAAIAMALGLAAAQPEPGEVGGALAAEHEAGAAVPFPAGPAWDYPLSAEDLRAAVAARDESRLRRHGWYLFAGVNHPGPNDLPIWRTWPTSTQAYAPAEVAAASGADSGVTDIQPAPHLIQRNADKIPVPVVLSGRPKYLIPEPICDRYNLSDCPGTPDKPFSLPDGPVFQSNGDMMIAGVIYNQTAYEHIRGADGGLPLFDAATLTAMLPPDGEIAELPGFPSGAMVLKHMYWPVKGDRCTALPVWDDPEPPAPDAYMGQEFWERAVAIASEGCAVAPGGTTGVSFMNGILDGNGNPLPSRSFENAEVVSLDAFFHQTFSQADLDALDPRDRALLDASSMWVSGAPFAAGDSIVSIAMHILTKEMPGWTMQSYWWHDRPEEGPYAADRPDIPVSQTPGKWRNYLMTSEYGIPTAADPEMLPARFNPYIELVIHPLATNCRNCHQRAAWPRHSTGLTPSGAYQVTPIESDPGFLAFIGPDAEILKDLLLLDYQWSINSRAAPHDYKAPAQ